MSIEYRKIAPAGDPYSTKQIADFYVANAAHPYNFYVEADVRAHLDTLQTGGAMVWVAEKVTGGGGGDVAAAGAGGTRKRASGSDGADGGAQQRELVGLISAVFDKDVQFSTVSEATPHRCPAERDVAEIEEFAVAPAARGHGVGGALVEFARRSLFEERPEVNAIWVMVHGHNFKSRHCFERAGFVELVTFEDKYRKRPTTVLQVRRPLRVVGVQSGNAVDGIDVCVVDFDEPSLGRAVRSRDIVSLRYTCRAFETVSWKAATRAGVFDLRDGRGTPADLAKANYDMGEQFAAAALEVCKKHGIELDTVDLVSSHGQSIVGHPHYELGELSVIAQRCGVTAVGDFRPADVAAGGNGSPCTCTYDALMLRPPQGWRVCINIGGTTSMTFVPAAALSGAPAPVGLDPGIGVFYMDLNAQAISEGALEYDDAGKYARAGALSEALLAELFEHPHYQRDTLPISIGAEDFDRQGFATWQKRAAELGLSPLDFQATLTELTARSLALATKRFGPTAAHGQWHDVIVRGSVRKNLYFMERLEANLREHLPGGDGKVPVKSMSDIGLDEESWETVMYAMFGYLCVKGYHNFVPSCTGAKHAVVGGKICPGANYGRLFLHTRA